LILRRYPRQPLPPPPDVLGWRDWLQVATSCLGVLLGIVIIARSVAAQAYVGVVCGVAFLGWGGVRLNYIRLYFQGKTRR